MTDLLKKNNLAIPANVGLNALSASPVGAVPMAPAAPEGGFNFANPLTSSIIAGLGSGLLELPDDAAIGDILLRAGVGSLMGGMQGAEKKTEQATKQQKILLDLAELQAKLQESARKANAPLSLPGKLASDFARGLISEEEYKKALTGLEKGSGNVSVNINQAGDKRLAQNSADRFIESITETDRAEEILNTLDAFETVLDSGTTETGALFEQREFLAKLGQFAGIDAREFLQIDPADSAALRAASADLTTRLFERFKGNLNQEEVKIATAISPSVTNTVEGNRRVIHILKKIVGRTRERELLRRDYIARNGWDDLGFDQFWEEYKREHPLFTDGDRAFLQGKAKLAPAEKPNGKNVILLDGTVIPEGAIVRQGDTLFKNVGGKMQVVK